MTSSPRYAPASPDTDAVVPPSADENIPDYYHVKGNTDTLRRRARLYFSRRGRRRFFDDFMDCCVPTASDELIDVGVTPIGSVDTTNFLEKWYPYPEKITATSVEDASYLEQQHPGLRFVQTDGSTLPFEDSAFDVVFSSAVLEHVGDRDCQERFVQELVRVGDRFFVITPNRWHPLEFHTFLPFFHWLPRRAHQAVLRAVGHHQWATTESLNLLSAKGLLSLFPSDVVVVLRRRRLAGFTSHLIAYGHRPAAPK